MGETVKMQRFKEIIKKYKLEDRAEEIAAQAVKFAIHAGRKTIKSGDIKLASKY